MTEYAFERLQAGSEGEFEVNGKIIETYNDRPYGGAFMALVEKPSTKYADGEIQPPTDFSEGVDNPTCSGKGGDCSREVDSPGDTCWQHGDE